MWKVKYGTGAEDPYLYSTNNFLGRQIFEFDPNAGTPEERAQVEEARQNFYRNRYKVKPSSDHIWRLQVYIFIYIYAFILCLFINLLNPTPNKTDFFSLFC